MERPRDRTAALAITLPPHATQALDEALSAVVRPEGAPLGPQARAVAVLTVLGLADEEIAELLSIEPSTVREHHRRNRPRLGWHARHGFVLQLAAAMGWDPVELFSRVLGDAALARRRVEHVRRDAPASASVGVRALVPPSTFARTR